MTSRSRTTVLATLLGAAAMFAAGRTAAWASPAADSARSLVAAGDSLSTEALALGRAAYDQRRGDRRAVIDDLEGLRFAPEPGFAEADRAAFLLGEAYLALGSRERFTALARAVGGWKRASVYTRWLAWELTLVDAERAAGDSSAAPGADALAPGVAALARARAGDDDENALTTLATADTSAALGRDLAGAAAVRLATRALQRGQDPRPILERAPARGRYAARARHMLGLAALERGDTDAGTDVLAALLADEPHYPARREVELALAGAALDAGRWDMAQRVYASADRSWGAARDTLRGLLAADSLAPVWAAWTSDAGLSDALVLDATPARLEAERLALASTDLRTRPASDPPVLATPASAMGPGVDVRRPQPATWDSVVDSGRALDEQAAGLALARGELANARAALGDRRRFLDLGRARVDAEAAALAERGGRLDALRAALDGVDARLRGVRDAATRRFAARDSELLSTCAGDARWLAGLRHFGLEGPDTARALAHPAGLPGPDSVVAAEEALARSVRAALERLAADTPGRIARSYAEAWRPGLIDRAAAEDADAARALAWARALAGDLDSSRAACVTSPAVEHLAARVAGLERGRDSLRAADAARRDRVARDAVARTLAGLESEREGIDYGLAASAYALAVRLGARDSLHGPALAVRAAATAADSASAADDLDDVDAAAWRARAIPLLEGFLARHPDSPARAEMRFRLADLDLVEARGTFRARMAAFVRDPAGFAAGGRGLPVLDPTRALALYRALLAEDPGFEHRDAVLFDVGMILADQGDPGAEQAFQELVTRHPDSAYGQEAWLRLGDMQFNEKRFAPSVDLYAHAAAGPDPTLSVIADYKMGWARFDEDRFVEAADAFAAVLDLYASERRPRITVDIEGEAEAYLVHSLAGAGGADAFAAFVERVGERAWEPRVLLALGQHFRRYGGYAQAAAADELFIRRHPDAPEALLSAQRLVETEQRADRGAEAERARLELAPRFAPDGDWTRAQTSDSLRAAGAAFARDAWMQVAAAHHRKAREAGAAADWREALRLYDAVLQRWPGDPARPTLELDAGEASARLEDWDGALRHYGAAAATGGDSVAALALWERVAVTDAWYERTRTHAGRDTLARGTDGLARAVIAAGDTLRARFPDHARGADIVWRQSQLGLAHGWDARATRDLATLAERWPDDPRAPLAASQRGDALFRLGDFEGAGTAFDAARLAAHRAGRDSLERRAAAALPVCAYRAAEAAVAADSTRHADHAARFERVATTWPDYALAPLAQYRAGLAYGRAGRPADAVRAMQTLTERFPRSPYVRDARMSIAQTWETAGERERAAAAYAEFAERHPGDESAAAAWLKAADLWSAARQTARADTLRLAYLQHYPADVETGMQIREGFARRELAAVDASHPLSGLLAPRGTGRHALPADSRLADYLRAAAQHPALASRDLIAEVRFRQGEEAYTPYAAARLDQPLTRSIPAKQRLLDSLLVRYRRTVDAGVAVWAHAAAFRIGEALVAFGDALDHAERPHDLAGDDLRAYDDVLAGQARTFAERGEGVWTDLLRKRDRHAADDPWIAQAEHALWQRLAERFLFKPETEFPLVEAIAPPREHAARVVEHPAPPARDDASGARPLARRQGDPR